MLENLKEFILKFKFFIVLIVIVIVICVCVINKSKKSNNNNLNTEKSKSLINGKRELEKLYDEEKNVYYLKDKDTGEIITVSEYEENLKFYEENPDFNPDPTQDLKKDLNDFDIIHYEEEE